MFKNKVPFFIVVGAVLFGLGLGTVLSGQVQAESQGLLSQLRVFSQVLNYVTNNYVEQMDSKELVRAAIRGMLEDLDPHSTYVEPEEFSRMNERNTGEYEGIGISFEIRDGYVTVISAIEGGPSDNLGIRPGDRIVEIEGQPAKDLSNQDVVGRLKGPKGTQVNIAIERPGLEKHIDFTIMRDKIPIYSVPYSFMMEDGKTGYVRLTRFSATTSDELSTALNELESEGLERLVLDLRNNSGGFLNQAIEVTNKFIGANEVVVYTKGRIEGSSQYYYSNETGTHPNYPLIVLVNHGSASASEIVSGAIQDHDRGIIAGVTTFGKGLVQRQYMLSDESALLLTVARYYTPSGRLIQRPYTDRDEYLEHWRKEEEQGEAASAAPPDTTGRPLFHTLNEKRPVYGGGGITPDVSIPDDYALTDVQSKLEQSRIFFEYANEFSAQHLSKKETDLDTFLATYKIPASVVDEFRKQILASTVVKLTPEEVDGERPYIEIALKREMAGNLWGSEARYRVILKEDRVLARAITHFPEAATMASRYQEALDNQR